MSHYLDPAASTLASFRREIRLFATETPCLMRAIEPSPHDDVTRLVGRWLNSRDKALSFV
jgi:hypothetical protein